MKTINRGRWSVLRKCDNRPTRPLEMRYLMNINSIWLHSGKDVFNVGVNMLFYMETTSFPLEEA